MLIRSVPIFILLGLQGALQGAAQVNAPTLVPNGNQSVGEQKKYEELLDRTSSLPPEHKADLGFTIIDHAGNKLPPEETNRALESIFHDAAQAQFPYPVTEAAGKGFLGTESDVTLDHSTASLLDESRLDTLEIQMGVIERALPATPRFSLRLFDEVELREDRASCLSANVENVSEYYRVALTLINDSRIGTIGGTDKDTFVLRLISGIHIPAEIEPTARLLSAIPIQADLLSQIEGAFVAALNRITASDREMTAAEENGQLTEGIQKLSDKLARAGISPRRLQEAYRDFLVRNLSVESCADHTTDRSAAAKRFNELISQSSPPIEPLIARQLSAHMAGGSAVRRVIHIDPVVMDKMRRIWIARQNAIVGQVRGGDRTPAPPESQDVTDVLQYATSDNPLDSDCPVCSFRTKGSILLLLLKSLPAGSELEAVLNAELAYLSFNDMERDDPVAWRHYVKELINAGRSLDQQGISSIRRTVQEGVVTPDTAPAADSAAVRTGVHTLGDPIISVYSGANNMLRVQDTAKQAR